MTPDAIRKFQASIGAPQTGVVDAATTAAMTAAVGAAAARNPDVARYAGGSGTDAIVNAYLTGDWSSVTSLTGKPFTDAQQQAAVAQAGKALAPAYEAQAAYDRAGVEDTLRQEQQGLADTQRADARQFGFDKRSLDQSAADSGVLFAGSRLQKQSDLRTTYEDRARQSARDAAAGVASAARGYQYAYGNDAAGKVSAGYQLPGAASYNAGVSGGRVTPGGLSSAYDPGAYKFQGTKPVAQQAAVQTRAASLLANRANKLSLSGYGAKF